MGGLQRLFLRITPIITLICFICLGITHIFAQNEQDNITYLTQETVTIDDNNTPQDETDDITVQNYEFDITSYRQNINADKLKQATEKVVDLQTFNNNYSTFNLIWADGYQIGDVIKTIGNAVILLININLVAINVILMPLRIIAGILITALSIVGININRTNGVIIPFLNGIITYLTIPLINPTYNNENSIYDNLANTGWRFNNTPDIPKGTEVIIKDITFTSNNTTYNKITLTNITYMTDGSVENEYWIKYDNTIVFNDGWKNQNYRDIYISASTNAKYNDILAAWLQRIAEPLIIETSPYYHSTFEWNQTVLDAIRQNPDDYGTRSITCFFTFTSNDEEFEGIIMFYTENTLLPDYICYFVNNEYIYIWYNGTWQNNNYQQFYVTQMQWDTQNDDIFTSLIQDTYITSLH